MNINFVEFFVLLSCVTGFEYYLKPGHPRRPRDFEMTFSYEGELGPHNWDLLHPNCKGTYQSPINIDSVTCPKNEGSLSIKKFDEIPSSIKYFNTGHSFGIKMEYADGQPAQFISSKKKEIYNVDSIHFHWGEGREGSEHTRHGVQLAAEVHIVAYNSKYNSIEDAEAEFNGIAILAVLYWFGKSSPSRPFILGVDEVKHANSEYTEHHNLYPIRDIIADLDFLDDSSYMKHFDNIRAHHYEGSLTSPNCTEYVEWMVASIRSPINSYDLDMLRTIQNPHGNPITKNFRPIQNHYDRRIQCF